jgi:hypothetical protein
MATAALTSHHGPSSKPQTGRLSEKRPRNPRADIAEAISISTEQQHQQQQQPRRQGITPIATPMSHSEALDEIKRHCGERRSQDITAHLSRLFAALSAAVLATRFLVSLQYWEQQQAVRNYITCELEGSEHAHVWSLLLVGSQDLGCERSLRPSTLWCVTKWHGSTGVHGKPGW